MKALFSKLSLLVIMATLPTMFTSCGDDEPETSDTPTSPTVTQPAEDPFEDLYGYWINTDNSGAMNIIKHSNDQCKVLYYVYCEKFPEKYAEYESFYSWGSFSALCPYNASLSGCEAIRVKISTSSYNRIVLTNNGSGNSLSSYIFNRVDEDSFYDYLINGGNGSSSDDNGDISDAEKLIGTWTGHDGDEQYTLTFYHSGKAREVWSDGYDTETMTGTYEYGNGKITSWNVDGTILENALGDCPWTVTFNSSTSMTLGAGYSKMTFTKQ